MTRESTVEAELFPSLDFSSHRARSGCAKPIGRHARGRRRRHASRPGILGQLLELRRVIEQQHAELMDELRTLHQARRIEHESLPAVLRRVTDIERHLRLVEVPTMPRLSRRRPLDG
jgi:hypothetical protein